ncbi:MAG: site-specific DNA-methyltransferase [Methermicoccaceae archaeon]
MVHKAHAEITVEQIDPDLLKPALYNPRKISDAEMKKLIRSVKQFGMVDPIIINHDNTVIGGHQRLEAARAIGLKTVPVVRLDLSENDAKLLNLALNKISGEWDEDKLANLLAELNTQEADLTISGFDVDELKALIDGVGEAAEVVEDEAPEPPEEPISKLGEIYELGRHRLMCGDATNEEDMARLMDGKRMDVLLTDPPYGINVVSRGVIGGGKKPTFGKVGYNHIVKARHYKQIEGDDHPFDPTPFLKLAPTIVMFGGNYFADKLPVSAGWFVWDKNGGRTWEDTFADGEIIYTSLKRHTKIYRVMWKGMVKEGESGHRYHPTQKLLKLITELLEDTSKEGQNVIDPFGGSGTTLIACEQLNRTCYMMELDPHYCDVIRQRYANIIGKEWV